MYHGYWKTKANLRDLIATTSLVNVLKLDSNHWFFSAHAWPSNLMDDLKNNRAPLLCYVKLCAIFQSHQWNQTGVTVRKQTIWIKISNYLSLVTLKFDRWPSKTIGHLFYDTSSVVHYFVAMREFELELQSRNTQIGAKFVLTSVTLTLFWPWPFAWTLLLSMVIAPEN